MRLSRYLSLLSALTHTRVDAHVGMYSGYTQASLMFRFEALINDLNFMMPEKFIDPVHLALNFRVENEDAQSAAAKAKRFKEAQTQPLSTLPRHSNPDEVTVPLDESDADDDDDVFYGTRPLPAALCAV